MNFYKVDDVSVSKNPHDIDARTLVDTNDVQVVHINLKPGEKLKKHITHTNVTFYVIDGEGYVEIGDEKEKVSKNTIIESPKNIPHCWYNESKSDLKILVIKAPRPTTKTKIL